MRQRLSLALVSAGILIATLGLAALLTGCSAHRGRCDGVRLPMGGCATVNVAAGVVGSSGLGYEQGYPTAGVEVAGNGPLAWRATVRAAQSAKVETGDGYGWSGAALLGWQGDQLRLLAGPVYTAQKTSTWAKDASYLRAELDWLPRGQEVRLWYDWRAESVDGLPGGQVERAVGAGWRSTAAWSPLLEVERVWFRSWGDPMVGERYLAGVAWRFGGR